LKHQDLISSFDNDGTVDKEKKLDYLS
jgi:hypothetical protein